MGEGLHFIDLIFYAMIAAFLIARLRNVLGRRTGYKRRPHSSSLGGNGSRSEPQEHETDTITGTDKVTKLMTRAVPSSSSTPLEVMLVQMQIADPSFNTESFLQGAQTAFKTIISAFATGELRILRPLLSNTVFDNFSGAIETRTHAGESAETQLLGTPTVEILAARMQEWTAFITLRFVSEQINVVQNSDGQIVEGNQNQVHKVVDVWTFTRDLRSSDPNWTLIETRSENQSYV
ncbi:Transporter [invertebrate metagenome]|uniref:Transporter n=1 Tax=invertebrate metagenome TaxID=1711999 RepID=A0A484H5L5_9ZZZZ